MTNRPPPEPQTAGGGAMKPPGGSDLAPADRDPPKRRFPPHMPRRAR
jgi:hypothetical protein